MNKIKQNKTYKRMRRYFVLTYKNTRHIQTLGCINIKMRKPYIHVLKIELHTCSHLFYDKVDIECREKSMSFSRN